MLMRTPDLKSLPEDYVRARPFPHGGLSMGKTISERGTSLVGFPVSRGAIGVDRLALWINELTTLAATKRARITSSTLAFAASRKRKVLGEADLTSRRAVVLPIPL
jgi:hypothetical protein